MKRITLLVCSIAISVVTFAQTIPCPSSFKRTNGAGGGCSIGKLTLVYDVCPPFAPTIDSVYNNGVKLDVTFDAGILDCSGSRILVTYCITSSNIPPTSSLTIYFAEVGTYSGSSCVVPASGGPLPIDLSSFVASRNGNNVNLKWQTSNEINAKEFVLQKKNGYTFIDVATIEANNVTNGSSYVYVDHNTSKGITEYRLRMVDLDNSFKFSSTRAIKGLSGANDFTVYPNPSMGNANVVLSETFEKAIVQLLDNAGRVIKSDKMLSISSIH